MDATFAPEVLRNTERFWLVRMPLETVTSSNFYQFYVLLSNLVCFEATLGLLK